MDRARTEELIRLRTASLEYERKSIMLLDHVKDMIDQANEDPQKHQPPDPSTVDMLLTRAQVYATLALTSTNAMIAEVLGEVAVFGRR